MLRRVVLPGVLGKWGRQQRFVRWQWRSNEDDADNDDIVIVHCVENPVVPKEGCDTIRLNPLSLTRPNPQLPALSALCYLAQIGGWLRAAACQICELKNYSQFCHLEACRHLASTTLTADPLPTSSRWDTWNLTLRFCCLAVCFVLALILSPSAHRSRPRVDVTAS